MLCKIFVIFALLLHALAWASDDGYYTIISPGTIHPKSTYSVLVSVHHAQEPCKMKLRLDGNDFKEMKEVEVAPMTAKLIDFEVPDIGRGDYSLTAEGVAGLIFINHTTLNYQDPNKPNVYIQTDKATYKPGDVWKFRVIFLDDNLLPVKTDKPIAIYITDADKNRIKQYPNVTLNKGVYSDKLELSDYPVLGDWELEVQLNGDNVARKTITIDKYVLPKYEVVIDSPKEISIMDQKLSFTIRAKYTYGKWVKGKAIITVAYNARNTELTIPIGGYNAYRPPIGEYNAYRPPIGDYYAPRLVDNHRKDRNVKMQKTIEGFTGKALAEFELQPLVPGGLVYESAHKLDISVTVEEELTGNKLNSTAQVTVVRERFRINAPSMKIDCQDKTKTFEYPVSITNLAGDPITDTKQAVIFKYNTVDSSRTKTQVFEAYLNSSGVASVKLNCAQHSFIYFDVLYKEQTSSGKVEASQPDVENLTPGVYVKTKNPTVGKPIEVVIRAETPIKYFVYSIVAQGNIIKSDIVNLPEASKTHTFYVKPVFEMVPKAMVYVHYIEDGDLKFYETVFTMEKYFRNSISIEAPKMTKPGEQIELTVDTNPESFVGLLGVDQSVLLLKSGNDLDGNAILQGVKEVITTTPLTYSTTYPGFRSGVVTLTNAHFPYQLYDVEERMLYRESHINAWFGPEVRRGSSGILMPMHSSMSLGARTSSVQPGSGMRILPSPLPPPPRIRKQFLENWFFDDFESSKDGTLRIKKQVPDTITSWVVTGFSMNSDTGFAITKTPTKIQTFRPFFISTNLPYSIKRGESVTIPVVVFNYMDQDLVAEVTLDNADMEYEFVDNPADQTKRAKTVSVAANNGETVDFTIRAKALGEIMLKISAISPMAGDAIHKKLKVEPEGVTVYKNRDFYVHVKDKSDRVVQSFDLDIPADAVSDSEHIEVSVMGDVLGSTITNLDKLVRMPSGCGEQNMINFVPNILVLRYLESIQKLSPDVERKAKKYMEIGYQGELNYKHHDGSYSAFGTSDAHGSTWLTAYVMRSFHQAAKYIHIDDKVLDAGLKFLANEQADNGSFVENGRVLDFTHYNEVGLTAFVLLAFLENSERLNEYKRVIEKGMNFLENQIQDTDDFYALSIAVYALQLHKAAIVEETLKKVDAKANIDGGLKWWTRTVTTSNKEQAWRPKSHDVEVTGYFLMTLLERNEPVLPITKWLISQRNSNGGFSSTQETVVGLQALIKFAEVASSSNADLLAEIGTPAKVGELRVNPGNALVVQSLQLPKQVRQVKIDVSGTGAAILQLSYRYNVRKETAQNFKLKTKPVTANNSNKLELEVCAEFVPLASDDKKESNMVVLEVALPSGYVAETEVFDKIKSVESVKRVETRNEDTNVVVYFDSLEEAKERCVPITAERAHEVFDQQPVPVVIYDYYDSQKRATEFY